MKPTRLFGLSLLCCAIASPARADVTLKSKGSGTGMVGAVSGDMTQYVKGLKIRIDQTTGKGKQTTTIIDVLARQMIVLDHDKKEADSHQHDQRRGVAREEWRHRISPPPSRRRTQTRQIAGQTCTVYDLKVAVPMQMGNSAMKMVMSGPQCLVKNGPGQADFVAFYRAAAEKGIFLDAAQAKSRPAMAKAMTDMYKQMAELGVPFATEMNIGIDAGEAGGPMAEMMKKMNNTIYDRSHIGLDRGDRRRPCSKSRRATRSASGDCGSAAPPDPVVRLPLSSATTSGGRGVVYGNVAEGTGRLAAHRLTVGPLLLLGHDDLVRAKGQAADAPLRVRFAGPGSSPIDDDLKPACPLKATDRRSKSSVLPRGTTIQ